jgi:hypothetical protein
VPEKEGKVEYLLLGVAVEMLWLIVSLFIIILGSRIQRGFDQPKPARDWLDPKARYWNLWCFYRDHGFRTLAWI